MSSYSAEAYRAAAEIAKRSYPNDLVGDLAAEWEAEAERMEGLANNGVEIIEKMNSKPGYYETPEETGARLVSVLLEAGWTEPKGLA